MVCLDHAIRNAQGAQQSPEFQLLHPDKNHHLEITDEISQYFAIRR